MSLATDSSATEASNAWVQSTLLQAELDRVASDFAGLASAGWECGAIVELHVAGRRDRLAGLDDANLQIV